jgi:hypothetical protein
MHKVGRRRSEPRHTVRQDQNRAFAGSDVAVADPQAPRFSTFGSAARRVASHVGGGATIVGHRGASRGRAPRGAGEEEEGLFPS